MPGHGGWRETRRKLWTAKIYSIRIRIQRAAASESKYRVPLAVVRLSDWFLWCFSRGSWERKKTDRMNGKKNIIEMTNMRRVHWRRVFGDERGNGWISNCFVATRMSTLCRMSDDYYLLSKLGSHCWTGGLIELASFFFGIWCRNACDNGTH